MGLHVVGGGLDDEVTREMIFGRYVVVVTVARCSSSSDEDTGIQVLVLCTRSSTCL
jgi:hypothetical protein